MPRPIRASFNLSSFGHNLAVVRRCAPRARVWAVVKAGGYGHSLLRTARSMATADGYALLDLDEAVRLRESGTKKPILLLEGFFDERDLAVAASHDLTVVVHERGQVAMLEKAAVLRKIPVYLKLNSGMNRLGIVLADASRMFSRLGECSAQAAWIGS